MNIGLHSSWIVENILAMQRPNDKILEKGVLQELINNKITAIFNLTEVYNNIHNCFQIILLSPL